MPLFVMADGVVKSEGNTAVSVSARTRQLTGVRERGTLVQGLPRNRGRPERLLQSKYGRETRDQIQAGSRHASRLTGANPRRCEGIAERRKRSEARRAFGSRSC